MPLSRFGFAGQALWPRPLSPFGFACQAPWPRPLSRFGLSGRPGGAPPSGASRFSLGCQGAGFKRFGRLSGYRPFEREATLEIYMRPDLTLEGEIAKAPWPLSEHQRKCLDFALESFGQFFDDLRLLSDTPVSDPRILPDLTVSDRGGSALFLNPLYLSAQATDNEGVVTSYNIHLKMENIVELIEQYDYKDMITSLLYHSIAILFEMECQFYNNVKGYRKDIIDKFREIFNFDSVNYKNVSCFQEISDKLDNIIDDLGINSLDFSWAYRYYKPGMPDDKVCHIQTYFCECGGAMTFAAPLNGFNVHGAANLRCPLCQKLLVQVETVH